MRALLKLVRSYRLSVKKISNSIFYINGQIYIYTLNEFVLRVAHKFEVEDDLEIHDDCPLYEYIENDTYI